MPKNTHQTWRLSSLKQLVLLSFLVIVTPFGILIYFATDALVEQSAQGRVLAQQALEVTRRGQQLELLAEDITRSVRQFKIVAKPEIKTRLSQAVDDYRRLLNIHSFLLDQSEHIVQIAQVLNEIQALQTPEAGQLLALTRKVNEKIDKVLDKKLQSLNEIAQVTQAQLSTMAIILLILEAILILIFSLSIIRPVKRIAARIQAMGTDKDYTGPKVGGPDELVDLDNQLDWLSQQLAEVEKEKQRFLRHMSHELKTPLTTLREGSDLLADQITGELNDSQMEVAQLLQSNARQLQSLIEQLLDYSRLSQHEPINLQVVDLNQIIRESIEPYKLLLEQKMIAVSLPEQSFQWMSDRAMLIRILGNLISNAALYGTKEGELKVTISPTDQQLSIEVGNKGPIIPEDDVPHLFDPFYQGLNRRLGPVKGSGIGLSIVRDAADAIGADIRLNRNQDHYVSFRLCLPPQQSDTHD